MDSARESSVVVAVEPPKPGRSPVDRRSRRVRSAAPTSPSSLALVAALAVSICGVGCGRAEPPPGTLTDAERGFYGAISSFDELFEEVGRIDLSKAEGIVLSVRPLIQAIRDDGELVVLDKLNVREIYVFEPDGSLHGRIGDEGRGPGEYIYPHALRRDPADGHVYVYDGDLLRVNRYARSGEYLGFFQLPLVLQRLIFTGSGRLYGYASTMAQEGVIGDTLWELDREGVVLNSFAPQSKNYTRWGASEGGGVAESGGYLYVVTPYEYRIRVYTEDGRLALEADQDSPYYVPPGPPPVEDPEVENFVQLQRYHQSWAHIRQVLSLGDRFIAVTFAPAGGDRLRLDVFDRNLEPVVQDIEVPEVIGEIFTRGDELYLMPPNRVTLDGRLANPSVLRLRLRRPAP